MNTHLKKIIRSIIPDEIIQEVEQEVVRGLGYQLDKGATYVFDGYPETTRAFKRLGQMLSFNQLDLKIISDDLKASFPVQKKSIKTFLDKVNPDSMHCLVYKRDGYPVFLCSAEAAKYSTNINQAFWFSEPEIGEGVKRLLMLPDATFIRPVTDYFSKNELLPNEKQDSTLHKEPDSSAGSQPD